MKRREKNCLKDLFILLYFILFFEKKGVLSGKGATFFFNSVDLHFINVRRGGDVGLCKLPVAKTAN